MHVRVPNLTSESKNFGSLLVNSSFFLWWKCSTSALSDDTVTTSHTDYPALKKWLVRLKNSVLNFTGF